MKNQSSSLSADLIKISPGHLNIMGYLDRSKVNGPGSRAVVWVQGCLRECPGCFNPASWSFEINQSIAVDALAHKILSDPENEDVTFDQMEIHILKDGTRIFTGYQGQSDLVQ